MIIFISILTNDIDGSESVYVQAQHRYSPRGQNYIFSYLHVKDDQAKTN